MPSRSSRRSEGTRERLGRVLIVTEGQETEPRYLGCFRRFFDHRGLTIHNSDETSPENLLPEARHYREKQKAKIESSYFSQPYDSVWIVFDRNGNKPEQIKDTVVKAKRQGIKIAFS